jgi:hypothetical protein
MSGSGSGAGVAVGVAGSKDAAALRRRLASGFIVFVFKAIEPDTILIGHIR